MPELRKDPVTGRWVIIATERAKRPAQYAKLAEEARQEAYEALIAHAAKMGANAVIAMRYDANEMASAVTEVLAYGTAVVVEEAR